MKKIIILVCFLFLLHPLYPQPFTILWNQCIGGTDNDGPSDIIKIDDGYMVAGATLSNDGDVNSGNHGAADAWLIKLDLQGNILWERCYGGTSGDNFQRIFRDSEGSFILTGSSSSTDGDISYNPYPGSESTWIVKMDSLGNIVWDRIVGGNATDQQWYAILTGDDGVLAYGRTASHDGDISVAYGAWDIWMIKLSNEGEIEWDFTIGTNFIDEGYGVIQTSDGGYLCSGSCWVSEGTYGNLRCDAYHDLAEAVLVKLDKDRNIEWQKCYGGSNHDGIATVHELEDGYIFAGSTNSHDGDLNYNYGESDIWVVKTDFDGNIIWSKSYGGSKTEYASKIFLNENGGFVVFGTTNSNDIDVNGNHSGNGQTHDIWVIRLSSTGELLAQQCIGGGDEERMNWWGVIKKSDYNYVLAGTTTAGPSFDVTCFTHQIHPIYAEDIWVLEIADTTTGMQESPPSALSGLKVFPNPARDYVCFEYSGQQKPEAGIMIFNSMGAQISNPVLYNSGSKIIWDTRQVPPGVYFYTYTLAGFTGSGKIVIDQ